MDHQEQGMALKALLHLCWGRLWPYKIGGPWSVTGTDSCAIIEGTQRWRQSSFRAAVNSSPVGVGGSTHFTLPCDLLDLTV